MVWNGHRWASEPYQGFLKALGHTQSTPNTPLTAASFQGVETPSNTTQCPSPAASRSCPTAPC